MSGSSSPRRAAAAVMVVRIAWSLTDQGFRKGNAENGSSLPYTPPSFSFLVCLEVVVAPISLRPFPKPRKKARSTRVRSRRASFRDEDLRLGSRPGRGEHELRVGQGLDGHGRQRVRQIDAALDRG